MTPGGPDLAGARAVVMGLGLFGGGASAARWLAARGARVLVTDLRSPEVLAPAVESLAECDAELVLGEHRAADFEAADLVVVNPAVPPHAPLVRLAREAGARITSELELALERCPARLVLVSGTQGKSSTVSFLHQLCEGHFPAVHLAGNIGAPLLERVEGMGPEDVCVVEVSSYQLEALPETPLRHVGAVGLTNVGVDHLERHGDAAGYAAAKARLFSLVQPRGHAFIPAALHGRAPFAERLTTLASWVPFGEGCALTCDGGVFRFGGLELGDAAALQVPGSFQHANVLLALGLALRTGVRPEALNERLPELGAPPHRFEDLGWHGGVRVHDNGVSTTPDSTRAALEALEAPVTLLVGGAAKRDLEGDLRALAQIAAARGDRVVTFGAAAADFANAFRAAGATVEQVASFDSAVQRGLAQTPRGEALLFSPAAASFDAFPNFRARAEAFRALLPELDPS